MPSSPEISGPRLVRFPQDVPQITELVELCFSDVLDPFSRQMMRTVRGIAKMGSAVWALSCLVGFVDADDWVDGVVWPEENRIVGNVTLTLRKPERGAWLLSNVAVHPDFRHRGLAHRMVELCLEEIRSRGGRVVLLQVDAENPEAGRIYGELGFVEVARRVTWVAAREPRISAPDSPAVDGSVRVSRRKPHEWREEYAFWKEISPLGSAWNMPLRESLIRPSLEKGLGQMFSGEWEEHYLARRNGHLEAVLLAFIKPFGWEGVLLQREGSAGLVEATLLDAAGLGMAAGQGRVLETTPEASMDLIVKRGFQKRRTLIWMRYTI
jgi:ribosomal protein S18 acetylase RimI-like enzyme